MCINNQLNTPSFSLFPPLFKHASVKAGCVARDVNSNIAIQQFNFIGHSFNVVTDSFLLCHQGLLDTNQICRCTREKKAIQRRNDKSLSGQVTCMGGGASHEVAKGWVQEREFHPPMGS